jgi:2-keto-4-pentenoate hydratase
MASRINTDATVAAAILWDAWRRAARVSELPSSCRPRDRAAGYAIQAALVRLSGQAVVGWKIAATSPAGQRHIGVDGPLAGPLLAGRLVAPGATVDLSGNSMRVAEAEFAFRMAKDLRAWPAPYVVEQVADAVGALHLAIEVPDSRYERCETVGGPQLIADLACASWASIGPDVTARWRTLDLDAHAVRALRNGRTESEGSGANVGGPLRALTWLANELASHGHYLRTGDVVITGTCVPPVPIAPGDRVRMDFGFLGAIELSFDG